MYSRRLLLCPAVLMLLGAAPSVGDTPQPIDASAYAAIELPTITGNRCIQSRIKTKAD